MPRFAAVLGIALAGCKGTDPATPSGPAPGDRQADEVRPLVLAPERRAQLESDLDGAAKTFASDPSEENTIWLGRRHAYLGQYRRAIGVFSDGIARYPRSYKLLRHRGHRYITLREFDRAIADLSRAAELSRGVPDEIEPDGAPNAQNRPRSTSHSNI